MHFQTICICGVPKQKHSAVCTVMFHDPQSKLTQQYRHLDSLLPDFTVAICLVMISVPLECSLSLGDFNDVLLVLR